MSVVFIVGCIIEEREEKYKREGTMELDYIPRKVIDLWKTGKIPPAVLVYFYHAECRSGDRFFALLSGHMICIITTSRSLCYIFNRMFCLRLPSG